MSQPYTSEPNEGPIYGEDVMCGCFHEHGYPMPDIREYQSNLDEWKKLTEQWIGEHPPRVLRSYLNDLMQYQLKCMRDPQMKFLQYYECGVDEECEYNPNYPIYPILHKEYCYYKRDFKIYVEALLAKLGVKWSWGDTLDLTMFDSIGEAVDRAKSPAAPVAPTASIASQESLDAADATDQDNDSESGDSGDSPQPQESGGVLLDLQHVEMAILAPPGTPVLPIVPATDHQETPVLSESKKLLKYEVVRGSYHPDRLPMPKLPKGRPTQSQVLEYAKKRESWISEHHPALRRHIRDCLPSRKVNHKPSRFIKPSSWSQCSQLKTY